MNWIPVAPSPVAPGAAPMAIMDTGASNQEIDVTLAANLNLGAIFTGAVSANEAAIGLTRWRTQISMCKHRTQMGRFTEQIRIRSADTVSRERTNARVNDDVRIRFIADSWNFPIRIPKSFRHE